MELIRPAADFLKRLALSTLTLASPAAADEADQIMVPVPEGAGLQSVAYPEGNGEGLCLADAVNQAFDVNNGDIPPSPEGIKSFGVSASKIDGDATLGVFAAVPDGLYSEINIEDVVSSLNEAFGDATARAATPNDFKKPETFNRIDGKAIVLSASFRTAAWARKEAGLGSEFCSSEIRAANLPSP